MRLALWVSLVGLLSGCGSAPIPEALNPFVESPDLSVEAYRQQRAEALQGAVRVNELTGQKEFAGKTEYVILSDFQFSPNELHFTPGTIVRIRLSNTALVTHYFGGEEFFRLGAEPVNLLGSYIPEGQHHVPVAPLTDRDIFLFIKDPGEYRLDCFVPNHRAAGMIGQLVVDPRSESTTSSP